MTTKPGFGGFVTILPAYFSNHYQNPPHNPTQSTRSTQAFSLKALQDIIGVECGLIAGNALLLLIVFGNVLQYTPWKALHNCIIGS